MKTKLKKIAAIMLLTGTAVFMTSCASTGSTPGAPASLGGTKAYPRQTCLVTDNDLGSMGDEQRIVYQGQELKFCCKPCVEKFKKNPAKYLQKLN
jgi:hypothetical protein